MANADQLYIVSTSPHAHEGSSVQRIMLDVIVALLPAMIAAACLFGWHALRLIMTCVTTCVLTEAICRKMMNRDAGITDLSAVVTGILLAFNLPPSLPSWMAALGSVAAIAIAKQLFGGIGYNPFNPALVGRVVLLISFPAAMTKWHDALNPARWTSLGWIDAITTATPLGTAKTAISAGQSVPVPWDQVTMLDFFLGRMSGCVGETSALALILGGVYLLCRRCISWHIPVFYIGTAVLFAGVLRLVSQETNMPMMFHVLSGGLMLGAFFMATDMVTSPITKSGMMIFGAGCGLLTMVIRRWGGYPEGASFAILLMNSVTPLINRATRPRVFGKSSTSKKQ